MLEKAKETIENIEQNDYLTAAEAWFLAVLHDLLTPVDDEDDEEGDDDDD